MDKQTRFILQLLFITLATAALFLPWVTVVSVSISLYNLQFGPVVLVFILFSAGLAIHGFARDDMPVSPLLRASLWAANVVAGIGHAVYWLTIAEPSCIGPAPPVFVISSLLSLVIDVKAVQAGHLRLLTLAGVAACVLATVVGLASGWSTLNLTSGQKMPRTVDAAMRRFGAGMVGVPIPPMPSTRGVVPYIPPPTVPSPTPPADTSLPEPPKLTVSVSSWAATYQLGRDDLYRPGEGKKYIVAKVAVANISSERVRVESHDFELTASDRTVHRSLSFMFMPDPGIALLRAEMLPHGSATGNVVFEVDRSVQPVSIQYRPLFPF